MNYIKTKTVVQKFVNIIGITSYLMQNRYDMATAHYYTYSVCEIANYLHNSLSHLEMRKDSIITFYKICICSPTIVTQKYLFLCP